MSTRLGKEEVYLVSACRSPIGELGGGLKDLRAADLSAVVASEAMRRAGIGGADVDEVVWGECHQQADQCNTARVMSMKAGLPKEVPATTVNKVCTSAMQAMILGVRSIRLGDASTVLVGGVESMSSAPYVLRTARWGQRLKHGTMGDTLWEGFTCGISNTIMGMTAENLVLKFDIGRKEQDEVAYRSQFNACDAISQGRFKEEIVPVSIPQRGKAPKVVDTDEHPRPGLTMDDLSRMKPIFREGGTVTAGNSSGINDGAAALILMSGRGVKERGVKPLARVAGHGFGGVEPELMGYGPVPAVRQVLERTGLNLGDIGLVEVNEAFAAQYLAVERLLGLDREKTNVNGSGIGLGHPVGSTGARIVVTLVHEMLRRGERWGLATLCGMGGVSTAVVLERP